MSTTNIIETGAALLTNNTGAREALRVILRNGGSICNSRRPLASITRARQTLLAAGLVTNDDANTWSEVKGITRRAWNLYATRKNAK